jgi:hypothetical protein
MFSAREVALNVTTASVQLRVLHNSVYLSARLKLRGNNCIILCLKHLRCYVIPSMSNVTEHVLCVQRNLCYGDFGSNHVLKLNLVTF